MRPPPEPLTRAPLAPLLRRLRAAAARSLPAWALFAGPAAGLLGACGERTPRWVDLAALGPDEVRFDLAERPLAIEALDGRPALLRQEPESGERWLELPLAPADWRSTEPAGTWVARVPRVLAVGRQQHGLDDAERLEGPRGRVQRATLDGEGFHAATGVFLRLDDLLQLRLAPGERPPEQLTFSFRATHGLRGLERFRVFGRQLSGDGFALPPGTGCELELALRRGSVLRFATCSEPALESGAGSTGLDAADAAEAPTPPSNRFRVLLDGIEIYAHDQPLLEQGSTRWHALELPASARTARLRFEVEGPYACTAFLSPTIGPALEEGYGGERRRERRPSLVLFAADTLRADCLTPFSEDPTLAALELAPALERLALESRVFTHARSVSTWTLPAFSSMLTGLFPHQLGATRLDAALPQEATTLAETLQGLGYRTAAVTEGGFVSRNHGLAQGFAWFREGREDLDATLRAAEEALAADDGRPLFLFVHTFRTHAPYVVSEPTRARLGQRLGLADDDTWERWSGALEADPGSAQAQAKLRALYLGGVADLDRGFAGFRTVLERSGLFSAGFLLFTSDHGEAFGEHGESLHTGPPFEVLVRVPLILHGPGLAPGLDHGPASTLDVTPTLLALAGAAPESSTGRSLFDLDPERAVYAFQCAAPGTPSKVAVVQEELKVFGLRLDRLIDGSAVQAAYDLEHDPHETNDLGPQGSWTRRLLEAHDAALESALAPQLEAAEALLDPLHRAELEALGYIDDASAPPPARSSALPAAATPGR